MDWVLDSLLIIHFAGLMLGAGGGLGSTVVTAQARAMPPEQAGPLRSVGPALARMSTVGLILLLLSGPALVSMKYGGFAAMPTMFWVKLVFVGTLTLAAILIEVTYARVKKGDVKAAALLPGLGPVAGISSVLAVIFAALAFH
jgi:protoporphyrinogen IX oxidase